VEEITVTATRVPHNGAWQLAAMVDHMMLHRTYYGYTRDEAVSMFRDVIRQHGYGAFPVRVAS